MQIIAYVDVFKSGDYSFSVLYERERRDSRARVMSVRKRSKAENVFFTFFFLAVLFSTYLHVFFHREQCTCRHGLQRCYIKYTVCFFCVPLYFFFSFLTFGIQH